MLNLLLQTAGIEAAMLDNDKLLVVLAVVLVIWIGIVIFIVTTDRKIERIESYVKPLLDKQDSIESDS